MIRKLALPWAGLLVAALLSAIPSYAAALAAPAPGPVSFVGSAFNGSARGATSITIDKPSGVRAGDVMVAMLGGDYSIPGTSPGWTKYAERNENLDLTGQAFYRIAGDSEPSSYTWPIIRGSSKEIASGTIAAFRGADPQHPMYSFAINGETQRTDRFSDCPSTGGVAGGALICTWIHDDPQRPQAPAGMIPLSVFTIPGLNGNDDGHATAYKLLADDGPTGVQAAALDTSIGGGRNDMALAVVVRPNRGLAPVSYVSYGDSWRFRDNGSNQGTAWRARGFNDSSWSRGPAQLGYGDGDEATVVASGPRGDRHITTYFRASFTVADPAAVREIFGGLVRDDGAVVYVNGTEAFRTNMPTGTVGFATRATATVGGSAESTPVTFTVPPRLLVPGQNTLAVEIHQRGPGSSDISFDLELTGMVDPAAGPPDEQAPAPAPVVSLVATGASSINVSWTASADDSGSVSYEVFRNGALVRTTAGLSFSDSGLLPNTEYEYVVEATDPSGNRTASTPVSESTADGPLRSDPVLVAVGSVWSYLDNGSNQGTGWRALGFNDSSWSTGAAELGYGDGDETTVVASGPSGSRHITTYFRRHFPVGDPGLFDALTLSLKRDDGAVVYINGAEVARSNMGSGTITSTTRATTGVYGSAEDAFITFRVPASVLRAGDNVIAVEIHQRGPSSSDITFDAGLEGAVAGDELIAAGSVWKYLDNGSNQGTGWRSAGFNESSWPSGAAQLGFGDGDETTLINGGPSGNRHITTYFRRDFTVGDPGAYTGIEMRLKRDDGAVIFINGTEVARSNMGSGAITSTTRATTAIAGSAEDAVNIITIPASVLRAGSNVIAVEIHQRGPTSSDLSFDLSIRGIR